MGGLSDSVLGGPAIVHGDDRGVKEQFAERLTGYAVAQVLELVDSVIVEEGGLSGREYALDLRVERLRAVGGPVQRERALE